MKKTAIFLSILFLALSVLACLGSAETTQDLPGEEPESVTIENSNEHFTYQ